MFIHVPKCGGVTVSNLLMNEYHSENIFSFGYEETKLAAYGFHLSLFEIEEETDISEYKLITFLRNPIDRVLSEHRFCMGKWQGNSEYLLIHKLPPEGDPIQTASNIACKMISGLDDQDPSIPIERHLEYAKKNLIERCFFVGITEKMEESIHCLYSLLGWKLPEKIIRLNTTEAGQIFCDEVLHAIAERNWADIELYKTALGLFEQKRNQVVWRASNPSYLRDEYKNCYHYTFKEKLEGYGWGVRERKLPYRWAAESNEAAIDFALEDGLDYVIGCSIFIQPLLLDYFSMAINNIPIELEHDYMGDPEEEYQWIQFKGKIPREAILNEEKTRIVFRMTIPKAPVQLEFYEEDNRQQDPFVNYVRGKFACKSIEIERKY